MRILGIDPGLATTGWSIIDFQDNEIKAVDYGVVSTEKGQANSLRIEEIYNDLQEIITKYKPEYSSVELLLFNNNAKTAMAVGEARGVILLVLQKNHLPIYQYTPPQIKSAITGSGRADKRQVQENVKAICGLNDIPKPDDAADAIAIAICCYNSMKIDRIVSSN